MISQILPYILAILACCKCHDDDFHLTILHTSEVTSNAIAQYDSSVDPCSEEDDQLGRCFGGAARIGTIVNQVRNERDDINVLLMDGGDRLFGQWYDIYRGNATTYFMNNLDYDVMTFGNHEFIFGPDNLGSFIDQINFDAVSANLNATLEPGLDGRFNRSVVKVIDGDEIGIIGYGTQVFNEIAQVGDAYFEDAITAVQAEVDYLTSLGVNKIIVLGHSWGYLEEVEAYEIAKSVSGVDILVIGGLNLAQYAGCPFLDEDLIMDYNTAKYPIVVTPEDDPDGKVLVVTAYPEAKFIGRLNVVFDDEGNVCEWYGKPIRLDDEVEQDPDLLAKVTSFADGVSMIINRIIGRSLVFLRGSPRGMLICRREECNMGNLIADAMVWKYVTSFDENVWNNVSIAVMNGGGIRASIPRGDILFSDAQEVLPFGNTFDAVEIEGRYVKEMLEHSVSSLPAAAGRFLQVAGMEVTYDLSKPPYEGRVAEVMVRCTECPNNILRNVPLEDDLLYRLIVTSFIGGGGDGYTVLRQQGRNYVSGETGLDVLVEYIERFSPILIGLEGRISFLEETTP